jgi:GT2 family glycosyltransferase
MTPRLSIVIPSHARADLLALCLNSLQAHGPEDAEIIVMDDASDAGIITQTAQRYPGVRVIRFENKAGFCVAINAGILASTGRFIQLLNDDTQVTAGWAEHALQAFADPRVGAVAPLVYEGVPGQEADPRIDSAGDCYDFGGFARKRGHGMRASTVAWPAGPVFGASGSSCFYRRAAIERIGLLPVHFGAYFEDVDWAHRLNRAGYMTWYVPESVVWHRVGSSHGRKPGRQLLERQSLNEERVFWRNVPLRYLPRHVAVLAGKALRRWREGTFLPFALGRLRIIAEIPALVRHRRAWGV